MAKRKKADPLGNALANHAQDETTYGQDFVDLPGGITGGIARLVDAKIGEYKTGANKGKPFLYMAGVVLEPKEAPNIVKAWQNGKVQVVSSEKLNVQGQRTSLMLPLCKTSRRDGETTTMDENIGKALNEVRKVGGEDCTESIDTPEDLEAVLEALKEAGPYFKFSTRSSDPTEAYPTQMVWESWRGSKDLEDYVPEEGDDVIDDTEEGEEPDTDEDDSAEEEDLDALGADADQDDEASQEYLTGRAKKVGLDPDDYEDWTSLADALTEGASDPDDKEDEEESEDEELDGEEEEDRAPEKEEVYLYKPPKHRKSIQCEVTAVFAGKQTCNLKSLDDEKVFKAVPWDKLEGDEDE